MPDTIKTDNTNARAEARKIIADEKLRHYLTTCPGCGDEALKLYEAVDAVIATS